MAPKVIRTVNKRGRKRKDNNTKKNKGQLTIQESFFKTKCRPKPQATASAKLKSSLKPVDLTVKTLSHLEEDEPELVFEEANNNDVSNMDAEKLKKSSSPETNNNVEAMSVGEDEMYLEEDIQDDSAVSFEQKTDDTQSRFKCKACTEWFPNRYFLRKHMLIAHEDQVYECRVCSFTSVEPEKLRNHILKLHVTKKERSENYSMDNMHDELEQLIERKLPRKVMMEDGVSLGRNVNSKMKYACALCSRIYASKYALERHVRCHTLEKPYQCDVCNFRSSYREHMMRHMTSVHLIVHSNEPHLKYNKNKKKLNPEEGLDVPIAVVDEDETEMDDGMDDSQEISKANKKRNILRQRYECAVCGMKSSHKSDLVDHIKEKHPNAHIESMLSNEGAKVHLIVTASKQQRTSKKLTIRCNDCSLTFHDTWKYRVHMRSHTGVKPFSCSECDFKASSKMTVRDHVHRRHLDVAHPKIFLKTVGIDGEVEEVALAVPWREFKCDVCGEYLKDNYSLKMHRSKEHKTALPFLCQKCQHQEFTRATMMTHCIKKHPGESLDSLILKYGKPLKVGGLKVPTCEICSRVFSYRSQLNNHMRLHTGERSLQCEQCDYKTNMKSVMDNHIMRYHLNINPRKRSKKTEPGGKKTSKTVPVESLNDKSVITVSLDEESKKILSQFLQKKSDKSESPKKKSSNLETLKKKSGKSESPKKKSSNLESPKKKSSNLESPKKKSSNLETPKKKSSNLDSPQKKSSNSESPKKKTDKLVLPNKKKFTSKRQVSITSVVRALKQKAESAKKA